MKTAIFASGSFGGRLIHEMPEAERVTLAGRIGTKDLDVLAVQEVEDIEALTDFNRVHLGGMYPHVTVIEDNAPASSTSVC